MAHFWILFSECLDAALLDFLVLLLSLSLYMSCCYDCVYIQKLSAASIPPIHCSTRT